MNFLLLSPRDKGGDVVRILPFLPHQLEFVQGGEVGRSRP